MDIGIGNVGSAWMLWATVLADPLTPEHLRAEVLTTASHTADANPETWFTMTARLAVAWTFYVPADDVWRSGQPFHWPDNTDPETRFEWEADLLPTPTPAAGIVIQWAFDTAPHKRGPTHADLVEGIGVIGTADRWPACDLAIRCLAARARYHDPLLDLRISMLEEAWAAWVAQT